jgi:hypothetical protein
MAEEELYAQPRSIEIVVSRAEYALETRRRAGPLMTHSGDSAELHFHSSVALTVCSASRFRVRVGNARSAGAAMSAEPELNRRWDGLLLDASKLARSTAIRAEPIRSAVNVHD